MLIIGASEISVYLAEIAKTLDFWVCVCDPREEYRSTWRVTGTSFVDGMPDDAVTAFKPDPHTVVIAVSHDPKLDDMALMEALKTPAFYVGAVGSKKTSEERRRRLQSLDVSAAEVANLGQTELLDRTLPGCEGQLLLAALTLQPLLVFGLELIE